MQNIANIIIASLSLVTATGIFIHDGRIDRAASTFRPISAKHSTDSGTAGASADAGLAGHPHTHPEKASRALKNFSYQSPSINPRENRSKKYMLQNAEPRGRHAFDNHYLPLVS